MHHRTVFLIPSDNLGWDVVRTALRAMDDVETLGEVSDLSQAHVAICVDVPDTILAATVVDDTSTHITPSLS